MPRENLRLVARLYELWNEGASMAHLLDPQFEWTNPSDAVEPGTLRSVDAARAGVAKIREIFPEHRFEPERYVETGEEVVVVIRSRARTATGLEVDWRGAHIWTVRERKIARLRAFNEVEQAFEAVGLRE